MSDKELWDALSVIARRMGLIERGQRLEVVGDPRDEAEPAQLCLAHGKYGQVRLLCTFPAIHGGTHTWERAMVGKSPCSAERGIGQMTYVQCELPTHHAGEHKATGADGVRWTWGDAPQAGLVYAANKAREAAARSVVDFATVEPTVIDPMGCMAWEWGTNGHKAGCMLVQGHEGPHKGVDADGKSVFTWPCPCYPDCTGHAAAPVPCGAHDEHGHVCNAAAGHEGNHTVVQDGVLFVWPHPTAPGA